VIAVLEHHQTDDGLPRVLKSCEPAAGKADLVITDLAVFDVTPEGLILREVAPGVSALDVQLKSDTPLLASDDLKVIDA
jgi:3-oxoacid CoA-transferase subunit B